jgi:UTP--glucose-1-phosphate uridylyltransferase
MTVDVAVVPVAGFGTRLLPLTCAIPKELLPLGRKPVLQHVVEELREAGIQQIVFVTGIGEDTIKAHFDIEESLQRQLHEKGKVQQIAELQSLTANLKIDCVNQTQQLGLGHAIACAQDVIGNRPFAIALGDAMFGRDSTPGSTTSASKSESTGAGDISKRLLAVFDRSEADAVIAFEEVPLTQVNRYGIAVPGARNIDNDGSFEVQDLIEKPAIEDAPSRYAVAARYVCRSQIFHLLGNTAAGVGGEIQLTDALRALISAGGRVVGVPLRQNEKRFDVGNFDSYFAAFVEVACADPVHGATLKKHLKNLLSNDNACDS